MYWPLSDTLTLVHGIIGTPAGICAKVYVVNLTENSFLRIHEETTSFLALISKIFISF